jgi:diaminopropionate ammonia-lyase
VIFVNPARVRAGGGTGARPDARAFHRRLPGYAPTRLVDAPALAAELGLRSLHVKDESHRLGLPAFGRGRGAGERGVRLRVGAGR